MILLLLITVKTRYQAKVKESGQTQTIVKQNKVAKDGKCKTQNTNIEP